MADEKITTEDLEASVRALLAAKIAYDTETDAALAASEAWSEAKAAGTKEPAWAMMAHSAIWRMNVDFPAMLGPVRMSSRL